VSEYAVKQLNEILHAMSLHGNEPAIYYRPALKILLSNIKELESTLAERDKDIKYLRDTLGILNELIGRMESASAGEKRALQLTIGEALFTSEDSQNDTGG